MNRRDFLKRLGAAGLVVATGDIIIPERRFWALDGTMAMPRRRGNDDTAWLQWYIDHGREIPSGSYHTSAPLVVGAGGVLNATGSYFRFSGPLAFNIQRPLRDGDAFHNNVLMPDTFNPSGVAMRFHLPEIEA